MCSISTPAALSLDRDPHPVWLASVRLPERSVSATMSVMLAALRSGSGVFPFAMLGCASLVIALVIGATSARASAYGLDLATAAFVAAFDEEAECGEGTCSPEVVLCERFDALQVDCVVGFIDFKSRTCGLVVRAVLRGSRIYSGRYTCHGRLRPLVAARFIRSDKNVRLRRFRAGIDWPASEERNRYGVPHYDTRRELYTGDELPLTGMSTAAELALGLAAIVAGLTLRAVAGRLR
jgi:hypothetical protein